MEDISPDANKTLKGDHLRVISLPTCLLVVVPVVINILVAMGMVNVQAIVILAGRRDIKLLHVVSA